MPKTSFKGINIPNGLVFITAKDAETSSA